MNRAQRRTEAARTRKAAVKHAAVRDALAYMAATNDQTISGATVILPDGEALYLSADTAQAMKPGRPGNAAGRA